jgi:hypothetical protein
MRLIEYSVLVDEIGVVFLHITQANEIETIIIE